MNRLEALAWDLINKYWKMETPIDLDAIAFGMGAVVQRAPLGDISGKIDIAIDGKSPPKISINSSEFELRQRFTLAHEIGHLVLQHGTSLRDPNTNFYTGVMDPKEVEANRFAASLLMPEAAVRYFIDEEGIASTKQLADMFQVSDAALGFRLKNLKIV
jgi:Zn-dependent peptidase ImmA (M78 family)